MTTYAPIKIVRGEDVTLSGTVTDAAGAVVNISAGSILFTVKNKLSDADSAKVFQKSGSGLTSGGLFTIAIASTDTISLSTDSRFYDAELTLAGAKSTISRGKLIISPEVTKA